MNRTEALLIGIILGLAIPKRLIHEWSILMRQRLGRWVRSHRAWMLLVGIVVGVAMLCSAFILGGVALSRASQTSDCLKAYLSGSAPLAAERDKATQHIWDDLTVFQTLDPTDKKAAARAQKDFFTDVAAEVVANKALQEYRDAHVPSEACS